MYMKMMMMIIIIIHFTAGFKVSSTCSNFTYSNRRDKNYSCLKSFEVKKINELETGKLFREFLYKLSRAGSLTTLV
jgi:hypothetical protein